MKQFFGIFHKSKDESTTKVYDFSRRKVLRAYGGKFVIWLFFGI